MMNDHYAIGVYKHCLYKTGYCLRLDNPPLGGGAKGWLEGGGDGGIDAVRPGSSLAGSGLTPPPQPFHHPHPQPGSQSKDSVGSFINSVSFPE